MRTKSGMCSIIIRTKNEERWIASCLTSVFAQSYNNFEVIIVDNESTDRTLEKVNKFPVKRIETISKYLPGASLNTGIKASTGEFIVCLSGHCIPVDEYWLENLVRSISESDTYAGVYGRQEPMSFSTPADKRDLLLVFGLDRRVQEKDSFFHNANSIIRRDCWEYTPFDDTITNIEDRVWAQEMLNNGFNLVYEPKASVYHYHGIHQDGNSERCNNVVRIIENMNGVSAMAGSLDPKKLEIVALIPVKGEDLTISGRPQIQYTIQAAQSSRYITRVVVATDDERTAAIATTLGAECPFLRNQNLSMDYVGIETVLKDANSHLEKIGVYADLIVSLEETFPFRETGLIDNIITHTLNEGFDTVIAARSESGSIWQESSESDFTRLDSGDVPRKFKEKLFIGLRGLCCVTHTEFVRQERIIGNKVGLFEVQSPLSSFEVRDAVSRILAEEILSSETIQKSMTI